MAERSFAELVQAGVLTIGDGYRAKLEELGGDGPLFLRAGALSDAGFDWNELDAFPTEAAARLDSKIGRAGDVVITTKGNSIGRVGWVPAEAPEFVYSPHLSYWRSLDGSVLIPRFLYYWSRGPEFLKQLHRLAFGTDMAPYLSLRDQGRLALRMPSIRNQRAIADVLGALDDKIAVNGRIVRSTLEFCDAGFAVALRRASFAGTFGELAEVGGGGTPKTSVEEYWGGNIRWATPTDVTSLSAPYLRNTTRTITEAGLSACSSPLYPRGSILMTSRATIGAFALAHTPVAVNQGFIVVNARQPELQSWLFHEMRARVPDFLSYANGATFLELPRGRFKQLSMRTTTPEVMYRFSETVKPLHELAAQLEVESARLAATRDELLPLLMSGNVRVKDAEQVVEGVL
jgi:type I restriction enzyme S subunit